MLGSTEYNFLWANFGKLLWPNASTVVVRKEADEAVPRINYIPMHVLTNKPKQADRSARSRRGLARKARRVIPLYLSYTRHSLFLHLTLSTA